MVMAIKTGDGIYTYKWVTNWFLVFSENFRTAAGNTACYKDILINDWFSGKTTDRRNQ
jgi:hypothetical protein